MESNTSNNFELNRFYQVPINNFKSNVEKYFVKNEESKCLQLSFYKI